MRKFIATVIALAFLLTYPLLDDLAEQERGHGLGVFGGEELLLLIGAFIVPGLIYAYENDKSDDKEAM